MPLPVLPLLLGLAHAGSIEVYDRAVSLVRHRYLDVADLDAQTAFAEAAEAAEEEVPWLLVDAAGGVATLRHGEHGTVAVIPLLLPAPPDGAPPVTGLDALPGALERLEDAIAASPWGVPDDADLPVALLRGLTRALDRHSVVLARDKLERFDERIKGKLSGIGARMSRMGDKLVIEEVFPGGPAAHAGLLPGDRVLRVDGRSMVGLSTADAIAQIRGPADTQLILEVGRDTDAGEELLELVLTRAEVVIPNVSWRRLPSGVGLIGIDHFSEQTATLMRQALADFEASGAPLAGIVLDLRGNSGGSMSQACRAADLFLEDGVVLRTAGRDGKRVDNLLREYRAHPEGVEPAVPLVVLMDQHSASASEILGGALALLDRAAIVGERSHGKGTIQKLYTVRGGGDDERVRLKLTVARYLLPGDRPIDTGVGLVPDLAVGRARFLRGGALLPHLGIDGAPDVVWVDERPGWREGVEVDGRGDVALTLAEDALLAAKGADRAAVVAALEAVGTRRAAFEDALLVDTFRYRGLDWRPADEPGPAPQVDVELSIVDPPVPGAEVEVRAVVHNRGPAPLYRVQVQLDTRSRLPWNGVTLPVGFLPPGEAALGSAVVRIGPGLTAREDLVDIKVLADARPPADLEPGLLAIEDAPALPLSVRARLVSGPDGEAMEIDIENASGRHIADLQAKLAIDADEGVELEATEVDVPFLAARSSARVELGLRRMQPDPVTLDLRIEGLDRALFRQQITLPADGSVVAISPARVVARAPRSAPTGGAELEIEATDDGRVESLTVWVGGDKVAWRPVGSARTTLSMPIDVPSGTHPITIEAIDDRGARTRESVYVRGVDPVVGGEAAGRAPARDEDRAGDEEP